MDTSVRTVTTEEAIREIRQRGSVYVWCVLWTEDGCYIEAVKGDLIRRIKEAAEECDAAGMDAPSYDVQRTFFGLFVNSDA